MLGFQVTLHIVIVVQIHLLPPLVSWTTLGIHLGTLIHGIRAQAGWTTLFYRVIFVPGIKASLFAVVILLAFADDLINVGGSSQLLHLVINSVETQPVIALIVHIHYASVGVRAHHQLLMAPIAHIDSSGSVNPGINASD